MFCDHPHPSSLWSHHVQTYLQRNSGQLMAQVNKAQHSVSVLQQCRVFKVRVFTMSLSKLQEQYQTLTFDEKVGVIGEVEKGLKKKCDIAKEYRIAPITLSG